MVDNNTSDFINFVAKGDNVKAGEAFDALMSDAVAQGLDAKKIQVASKMFDVEEAK